MADIVSRMSARGSSGVERLVFIVRQLNNNSRGKKGKVVPVIN
jgi:hypothetical protein